MAGQIPVALSILAKLGVVVCDVGEVLSLMTFAFRMSKSHLTASGKVDTTDTPFPRLSNPNVSLTCFSKLVT